MKNENYTHLLKTMLWGTDPADMQLVSKFNKRSRVLLFVINIYSKYAWVVPVKDEKGITITNAFQKKLHECNRKPSNKWIDKGSEFDIK